MGGVEKLWFATTELRDAVHDCLRDIAAVSHKHGESEEEFFVRADRVMLHFAERYPDYIAIIPPKEKQH